MRNWICTVHHEPHANTSPLSPSSTRNTDFDIRCRETIGKSAWKQVVHLCEATGCQFSFFFKGSC